MSESLNKKPAGRYIERARAFQVVYSLFFTNVTSVKKLSELYATCVYANPDLAQSTHVDSEDNQEDNVITLNFDESDYTDNDFNGEQGLPPISSFKDEDLETINTPHKTDEHATGFGWELVLGVWQKQKDLDKIISEYSQNWRIDRMGKVELALLRLSAYELLFRDDIPTKVIINEAIELSKKFGDDNSRNFINGILDALTKSIDNGTLKRESFFWNS